jgi:hypothetical protein
MFKRNLLLTLLLILFSTLTPLSYAASQQQCCAVLFNGQFLPLECGQYLGGSVLTLPERLFFRNPPLMCNATTQASPMIPMFPIFPPIFGMPIFIAPGRW